MSAEKLPLEPTTSDFRRVGAIISMHRGTVRPDAPWSPDECTRQLYIAKDLQPFPDLAVIAVAVAKDPACKGPAMIHFSAARTAK